MDRFRELYCSTCGRNIYIWQERIYAPPENHNTFNLELAFLFVSPTRPHDLPNALPIHSLWDAI